MRIPLLFAAALSLALPAPAPAQPAPKLGAIEGVVAFRGAPPERKPLDRSSDPTCAKTPALDESIVVEDGGVRDAFVTVKGGAGKASPPAAPVVIDQQDCTYRPRVVGVVAGQTLQIRNGDRTLHNIHAYRGGDTEFNLAQPARARPIDRKLDGAGDVIELKCDVHPWMRAYAVVVDHGRFAVSGKGGAFRIEDVPAGRHEVEVWHPVLGKQTAKVTVAAGKTARVTLTLSR